MKQNVTKTKKEEKDRLIISCSFFFQAEDGIRDLTVTGVQTCALPISNIKQWPTGCSRQSGINYATDNFLGHLCNFRLDLFFCKFAYYGYFYTIDLTSCSGFAPQHAAYT